MPRTVDTVGPVDPTSDQRQELIMDERRGLIVVDVQRDFCEGGALAVSGGTRVAREVSRLLDGDHPYSAVVATRDHHIDPGDHFSPTPDFVDSWPPHCVVGTPGVEFSDDLTWRGFDAVFDKGEYAAAYSGFEADSDGTGLADWLRDRDLGAVDVVGLATDHCVRATALDATAAGFAVRVLVELTAAVSPDRIDAVVDELRAAGAEVVAR